MTTHVFLERIFAQPLTRGEVLERARSGAWCFDMHKVRWHGSFLGLDGKNMVCRFSAPDLESARLSLRQFGADLSRLWAATIHDGPQPITPTVLVERSFAAPVRLEDIQAIEDGAARCLQLHRVRFARTAFSLDRKRMLCFYEAADAESVRIAQREAAMPLDAVWAFAFIAPSGAAGGD